MCLLLLFPVPLLSASVTWIPSVLVHEASSRRRGGEGEAARFLSQETERERTGLSLETRCSEVRRSQFAMLRQDTAAAASSADGKEMMKIITSHSPVAEEMQQERRKESACVCRHMLHAMQCSCGCCCCCCCCCDRMLIPDADANACSLVSPALAAREGREHCVAVPRERKMRDDHDDDGAKARDEEARER